MAPLLGELASDRMTERFLGSLFEGAVFLHKAKRLRE